MLRLSAKPVRTEVGGPLKSLLSDPGEGSGGLSSISILFQLIYGNFRGFLCLFALHSACPSRRHFSQYPLFSSIPWVTPTNSYL